MVFNFYVLFNWISYFSVKIQFSMFLKCFKCSSISLNLAMLIFKIKILSHPSFSISILHPPSKSKYYFRNLL